MSEDTDTAQFETQEFNNHAVVLMEHLGAIERIENDEQLQAIGSIIKECSGNVKAIKEHIAPQKADAHARHKRITELENRLCKPFNEIGASAKSKLTKYRREQERIAAEERAKAEAEARQKAEEERLAQAQALEDSGQQEQAEAILDAPMVTEPVMESQAPSKVDGVSTTKRWSAEVTDIRTLCQHVAESGQTDLVQANMTALNGIARALKSNMNVPGVKAVSKESIMVRS